MAAPEGKFVAVATKNRPAGVLATKNRLYRGEPAYRTPYSPPHLSPESEREREKKRKKKTRKILINLVKP